MSLRVKICGVTSVEDAAMAVELGADFLGLNFHPPSPRYLAPEKARQIADAVRGKAQLVGVFVHHSRREMEGIASHCRLDLLQLHGDYGRKDVEPFGARAIKVFRPAGEIAREDLAGYEKCWGFLFDRPHETLYGGTGETWSYDRVAALPTSKPVLLAGGVGPHNARSIRDLPGLFGIDVCSRVESAPGVKDRTLLEQLFLEVRDG